MLNTARRGDISAVGSCSLLQHASKDMSDPPACPNSIYCPSAELLAEYKDCFTQDPSPEHHGVGRAAWLGMDGDRILDH